MPHLSGITIYPFKSLDPVSVPQTRIVEGGGLEHDREFAFFDADGKYINGKRTPKVHHLCASVDWKDGTVSVWNAGRPPERPVSSASQSGPGGEVAE